MCPGVYNINMYQDAKKCDFTNYYDVKCTSKSFLRVIPISYTKIINKVFVESFINRPYHALNLHCNLHNTTVCLIFIGIAC